MKKRFKMLIVIIILLLTTSFSCNTMAMFNSLVEKNYLSNVKQNQELNQINYLSNVKQNQEPNKINYALIDEFFNKYFSVINEDLLILNRYPKDINEDYKNYYLEYKNVINKEFKDYLSPSLKQKLDKNKFIRSLDFPRFIDINGYTVIEYRNIRDIDYTLVKVNNTSYEYNISVDINVGVITNELFESKYTYINTNGYYSANVTDTSIDDIDEFRLKLNYIACFTSIDEKLYLDYIKEDTNYFIDEHYENKKENNFFVARLPYYEKVNSNQVIVANEFFSKFLIQDYEWFNYFNSIKSLDLIIDTYNDLLSNNKLLNVDENYFNNYINISPIVSDIKKVEKVNDIKFRTYIGSSFNNNTVISDIYTTVNLFDGSKRQVIYSYFLKFENIYGIDKISSIRLYSVTKSDELLVIE